MNMQAPTPAGIRARHRRAWLQIFFGGLLLWLITVFTTFLTGNSNLVPTVILLGSFLVPVTFVAYAFEHRASEVLSEHSIFVAFVYGGVLGVAGASVLEAAFLARTSIWAYFGVGFVEEASKLAALWLVALRVPSRATRDGIVLGAAVGFGFAALETSGYAFNALFTERGLSLTNLVETEILRGILTPVGHGLWTAILGGVLFRASRGGRLRITRGLLGWYVVVSLLHGFWDAAGGIAAFLVLIVTTATAGLSSVEQGRVMQPTDQQVHLFTILLFALLVLDGVVGIALLWNRWRRAAVPA